MEDQVDRSGFHGDHEMETGWKNEDLVTMSDSNESHGTVRKSLQYRLEDMMEDFKFKVGMEFTSLQQFKYASLEHSVLNGRQITFKKNDSARVRVVCKRKCDFLRCATRLVENKHSL